MHRILLVNTAARLGGAERSLLELALAIDRERFELLAVVGGEGPLAEALGAGGVEVEIVPMERLERTVNPIRLAGHVVAVAGASGSIAGIVRERGAELIHSNGVQSQVYAGEGAKRAGVPCVWHARDMVSPGPLAGRVYGNASRVIAISDAVRSHLLGTGAPSDKVRLVRNGLDLSAFAEAAPREDARRELGLDPGAFVAGTAGVFVPWKKHEDFIRAFDLLCGKELDENSARAGGAVEVASLVPARAVVFGGDLFGDQGAYAFELRKLADELGGGRIVFAGWREDMAAMLPALDVFVSASEGEPFGRVVVEAMAAGVPVVSTDSGGKGEIVEDGKTGILVPQGDVGSISRAMDELRRDPDMRARMSSEGRRVALEKFAVDRAAREVEAVWDEVLGGRPA
jgi:glycosyltransferase involved in cell wall biosynthesis